MREDNNPVHVRDLFEDNFINYWIEFLYSREEFEKKYEKTLNLAQIDANHIAEIRAKEMLLVLKGELKEKIKKIYEKKLGKKIKENDETKKNNFYLVEGKYTFLNFYEQLRESSYNINNFYEDSSELNDIDGLTDIYENNNFLKIKNEKLLPLSKIKLPVNYEENYLGSFDINKYQIIQLKALKHIAEKIFNLEINKFNDKYKKDFKHYNFCIIEQVLQVIAHETSEFNELFCTHITGFIEFAYFECFNIALNSKTKYTKFKELDKDYQKTKLFEIFTALLDAKDSLHKDLSNLKKNRQGSSKENITKEIIEKHGIEGIEKYWPFTRTAKATKKPENFTEKHIHEYELLKKLFDIEKTKKENNNKEFKYRNYYDYLMATEPKELAYKMFLTEIKPKSEIDSGTLIKEVSRYRNKYLK